DLLAPQVAETLDFVARQDMHFRRRHADDVVDAAFKIGGLALRAEILEHVRLRDRHIDAAEIEKIVEVRGRPVGDDRKNAQILAVIKNLRQFIGEGHVAAGQQAACYPERPLVLTRSQLGVWPALFKRFRYGLGPNRRRVGWTERAHSQPDTYDCAGSP